MQLCALDSQGLLVFASKAERHKCYYCLECGEQIRLRKGLHRQPHYYHTTTNRSCRQAGKGLIHLLLQHHLKNLLPENEAWLEYRFNAINRIADVVWLPRRLVYEIQVSPISFKEVQERNRDYATLGFNVIWILHDKRYNRKKITSAESFLASSAHYFTNMNEKGEGMIYDQYAWIDGIERIYCFPQLPIELDKPQSIQEANKNKILEIPFYFEKRLRTWRVYYVGDCIDTYLSTIFDQSFAASLEHMKMYDKRWSEKFIWSYLKELSECYIRRPIQALLNLLLERACR